MSSIYDLFIDSGVSSDAASWGVVIFFSFCLLTLFFLIKRLIQGKR